jgi:hypothetical protein
LGTITFDETFGYGEAGMAKAANFAMNHRLEGERIMRTNPWNTAALATLLALSARPVLASDTKSDDRSMASDPLAGAADPDETAQVRQLDERVNRLERRVDELGVPNPSPEPTPAQRKAEERKQKSEAEFLQQVWTAP